MTTVHATHMLLPDGWHADVRVTVTGSTISAVESGVTAQAGDERHACLLPGMANLHSHAFQRGMAGLTERRGPSADSFWSWRDVMYRFALAMTPDQVEAVAAQLYVEMLEAGFTRVGEFHYLHHDRDGRPYANMAEMASRICAAASESGIGLTLLPVFYAHAGFGGQQPHDGQRRFISDLVQFQRLLDGSRRIVSTLEGGVTGLAPHSLRAVEPEELAALVAMAQQGPIHLHIAEQVKEVEDCVAWSGQRPVEWLFDHAAVDRQWCLIHATHMTEGETKALAQSGAVAGLCPITEANLGDGIFNGASYRAAGGVFGIGSDSNIQIGLGDELRQLEYSQRLAHRARNVMADAGGSTGRAVFEAACRGGARALGVSGGGIAVGAPADFFSLNMEHPALVGRVADTCLDAFIFTGGTSVIDCVWSGGRKQVAGGRHRARDPVARQFRMVMQTLAAL